MAPLGGSTTRIGRALDQIVPGRQHFNASEEPAVLDTILRLLGG